MQVLDLSLNTMFKTTQIHEKTPTKYNIPIQKQKYIESSIVDNNNEITYVLVAKCQCMGSWDNLLLTDIKVKGIVCTTKGNCTC